MQSGNKKKKKLKFGDFLNKNSQGIGAGASFGSNFTNDPTLSGALKGAGALSALGPWGMLAGGVGGAALGYFQGQKAEELANEMQQKELNANKLASTQTAMSNLKGFKDGGKLLSKKLGPSKGGKLTPISDKAVEVKGDNPGKTDGVEIPEAFLDNAEVVDTEDRVYSDSVFLPSGKSVAKRNKEIEKMRTEHSDTRFGEGSAYYNHLNKKNDELFEFQETVKKSSKKKGLADGGPLNPLVLQDSTKMEPSEQLKYLQFKDNEAPSKAKFLSQMGTVDALQYRLGKEKNLVPDAAVLDKIKPDITAARVENEMNIIRRKYKKGGKLKPRLDKAGYLDVAMPDKVAAPFDIASRLKDVPAGEQTFWKKTSDTLGNIDYNKVGIQAATYGPNVTNALLQSKLKGPASPILEYSSKLKTFSADPQLAENTRQYKQAQNVINKNTGQASNLTSATGSLLAKKFASDNAIKGDINRLNTEIGNRQAEIDMSVRSRNASKLQSYNQASRDFKNKKLQLTSSNIGNLSEKVLMQGRERNQIALDKDKYKILMDAYSDLPDLMKSRYPDLFGNSKLKRKTGGKLSKKKLYKSLK